MKKAALLIVLAALAIPAHAQQYTNSYMRSNGTYVQGYYHTAPDSNPYNNYSSPQNSYRPQVYTPTPAFSAPQSYSNPYARPNHGTNMPIY